MGLYDNLVWQATRLEEIAEIRRIMKNTAVSTERIFLSPNIPSRSPATRKPAHASAKKGLELRIVFLSRITRVKNLHMALNLLQDLRGDISFDIYGPIEDLRYWAECQESISALKKNITVTFKGEVLPNQVASVLAGYHLFILPTRGENFGHVILEALTAGCLVLISDTTPWRNLAENGVGWDISLSDVSQWKRALEVMVQMNEDEFEDRSNRAMEYAQSFINDESTSKNAFQMFRETSLDMTR